MIRTEIAVGFANFDSFGMVSLFVIRHDTIVHVNS